MNQKFNLRITIFVCVAISVLFIGVAFAGAYDFLGLATYLACAGSFATFIVLLDVKLDRVMKGFALIAFGVIYQLIYPRFFYIFVDKLLLSSDLKDHFEVYGQVILLACAGAGGSLIAVYADKTSADFEPPASSPTPPKTVVQQTVIDNTRHIEKLTQETKNLTRIVTTLMAATILLIAVTVIVAIAIFFR